MIQVAATLVLVLEIYALVGVVFALAFVFAGLAAVDPAARGAPVGFRLLILPASAALWPWLALRWLRRTPPREERNAHRMSARARGEGA